MDKSHFIPVPGRLDPIYKDRVLAGADVIYDDALGKTQAEINSGIGDLVINEVNSAIRESEAINETIGNKVDEKVPQIVEQALNSTVMPAVQEMINNIPQQEDTNTTYKISLNGEVKGDPNGVGLGDLYAPSSAGTAGQYLKSTGNGAPVWAEAPSGGNGGITTEDVTTIINQALYGSNEKPQNASPVTTENLNTTLSGYLKSNSIAEWAKSLTKPGYSYGEIGYDISRTASEGGAVELSATVPVHEITASAAISGITFSGNSVPENGHSCHIIIKASETVSVSLANDATMATVSGTAYKSVCPKSSDVTLNITAGGYVEFDLLRIGESIYVRGI